MYWLPTVIKESHLLITYPSSLNSNNIVNLFGIVKGINPGEVVGVTTVVLLTYGCYIKALD